MYKPHVEQAHIKTNIEHIANDPAEANIEIVALRNENKRLNGKLSQKESKNEMEEKDVTVLEYLAKILSNCVISTRYTSKTMMLELI